MDFEKVRQLQRLAKEITSEFYIKLKQAKENLK